MTIARLVSDVTFRDMIECEYSGRVFEPRPAMFHLLGFNEITNLLLLRYLRFEPVVR